MRPVFALFSMASSTSCTSSSGTTTSIFTFGTKSTTYAEPRYTSFLPPVRPKPFTSVTVIPCTPTSARASLTSSSLNGLMMASIFFMLPLARERMETRRARVRRPLVARRSPCGGYHPNVSRLFRVTDPRAVRTSHLAPPPDNPQWSCRRSLPLVLGRYPTPVVRVDSLSTSESDFWVKRDDLTHSVYGGNKVRKLERLIADARARGATRSEEHT